MFIHDTLLEVVRVGHTGIFIQSLPTCYKVLMGSDSNSVVSRVEEEFNVSQPKLVILATNIKMDFISSLQYLNWIENVKESQFKAASRQENIPKNRSQAIMPCMHLHCYFEITISIALIALHSIKFFVQTISTE